MLFVSCFQVHVVVGCPSLQPDYLYLWRGAQTHYQKEPWWFCGKRDVLLDQACDAWPVFSKVEGVLCSVACWPCSFGRERKCRQYKCIIEYICDVWPFFIGRNSRFSSGRVAEDFILTACFGGKRPYFS